MRFSSRSQLLLTCLIVYASSAQAIMVKFGTKGGPIEPPTPEPTPLPQPYRVPAPVWEERSNDTPDPNAQWRPPFFVPQPRYTHVVYNPSTLPPIPLNNAQRFVNAYIPKNKAIKTENIGNPIILSSQTLPGVGLRYFVPYTREQQKPAKQEDTKLNHVESDLSETARESSDDFQWKYEKEATRRLIRNNLEGTARAPGRLVYQFPAYVQPQHR
ncbi:unnamed protein product [Arctia plantaginis]|uniref:Uncharacterized protein n=1 Tax=Arctia plantaginis TaxID=874455 RepID=A0A8S1AEP8_ARCPL|nr:unnamed protein product [Arctia plantaginis]